MNGRGRRRRARLALLILPLIPRGLQGVEVLLMNRNDGCQTHLLLIKLLYKYFITHGKMDVREKHFCHLLGGRGHNGADLLPRSQEEGAAGRDCSHFFFRLNPAKFKPQMNDRLENGGGQIRPPGEKQRRAWAERALAGLGHHEQQN